MLRKLKAILAAVLLATALSAAVPAAAAAAPSGPCVSPQGSYTIGGNASQFTTWNESVKATIDPNAYFTNCGLWDPNDPTGEGWSATSAWIAIQNPSVGGIVQLGIIECENGNDNQQSYCDATANPSLVMSAQGCGGIGATELDFGNIGNTYAHTYQLSVNRTNSRVDAYFDGTLMGYISFSDPRIGCFITASSSYVAIFAERRNRGDGTGLSATSPLKFTNMKIGSGVTPNVTFSPGCTTVQPSSGVGQGKCSHPASSTLYAWSVY